MTRKLSYLFKPKTVAIIGASETEGKVGNSVMQNILDSGYADKHEIYPVNPKRDQILGHKAYNSVLDIENDVDVVVICIPAKFVVNVMKECAKKGVKGAIIITAGFKEVGEKGAKYEREIEKIAKEAGIRVIGPNCLGIITPQINMSFASKSPKKGHIAMISQSGAMMTAVLDWADTQDIGFSNFVSIGNKMDLDEVDLIEEFSEDEETNIIILYIESVNNGEKFLKTLPNAIKKKPVIILKSGTSEAGSRAASSHTGALAGNDIAFDIAFEKCGVIRARTMTDLFDMARLFDKGVLPKGCNFAIVTNAGGPGIVATDAFEDFGVGLCRFSRDTIDSLHKNLPSEAAVYNPVDIIGDAPPARYKTALEIVFGEENHICGGALILVTPQAQTKPAEVANLLLEIQDKHPDKMIIPTFMGGSSMIKPKKILRDSPLPCYDFPEQAIKSIKFLCKYVELQKRPNINERKTPKFRISNERIKEIFNKVRDDNRRVLMSSESSEIFSLYGIKNPKTLLAKSSGEAEELSERIGFPLVMKIVSPDIIHKSDIGGVVLGIKSAEEARETFARIINNSKKFGPVNAKINGVELQEMIDTEGHDKSNQLIIGMSRDPQWGPLLMVGTGGIYANFLKDVSFDLAYKYTKADAMKQLEKTKIYSILQGVRGEKRSDIEAVLNVLVRLSQLVKDFPEIVELDINPLLVFEESENHDAYSAVDIKITISSKSK